MYQLRSPTRQDIIWLFNFVWPRMEYSASFRDGCLARLEMINRLFKQHQMYPNHLLSTLDAMDGIGLVIASGLIFSAKWGYNGALR